MTTRLALLASGSLFACVAAAQGITLPLPPAAAGVEQGGSTLRPWSSGLSPTRTLAIYDGAQLAMLGVTGPFAIVGLRWRANGGGGAGFGAYDDVQVSLSTTTAPPLSPSPAFAVNHGPDLTMVYSGPVAVGPAASTTPSSFQVEVVFATPFVFDPSFGDSLAVDVQCTGVGWTGVPAAASDAATGVGAGSMVTALSATASIGSIVPNQVPVIELLTTLPPLPPQLVINELVYDSIGANRQFVELYNASGGSINLLGWSLGATTSVGTTTLATMPSVLLPPGQYYVIGNTVASPPALVADLALAASLPTGNTTLTLRNPGGVAIDAVQYGGQATPVPPVAGEGAPLFGAHRLDPASPTSWSRQRDGYDTASNGLDFRIAPWTPKASNDLPDLVPYAANFDALGNGQPVPSWAGSAGSPVAIDPLVTGAFNPAVVVPSPQGGKCVVFATPNDTAGGRSFLLATEATSRMGFQGEIWFDATLAPPGQSYAWSIGVGGTTDADYAMPMPLGPSNLDANGDTGVGWTYVVTDSAATLYLISNAASGSAHVILAQYAVTTSAWRDLQIDLYDNVIYAVYDGVLTQAHVANSYGGLYVGLRNQAPGAALAALRGDDIRVGDGLPTGIIGVGPGCDGNCPPKNNLATSVERGDAATKLQPLAGEYAFRVRTEEAISFTQTCVLTHLHKGETSTTAALELRSVFNNRPGAVLVAAAPLGDTGSDEDSWWAADLALSQTTQADFFLVYHHDGNLDVPLAAVTKDPSYVPPKLPYWFRPDSSSQWTHANAPLPWAYKFACTSTSGRPGAGMKRSMQTGDTFEPTLDGTYYPTIGFLWLGFLSVPGIDLGFVGAPGCPLWVDITSGFGLAAITDPSGHAEFSVFLANDPSSIGLAVYQQWFVYDPTVNAFGWIASNALQTTIH